MASYAGFGLGHVQKMITQAAPVARQVNAYPGANGVEVVVHGTRGGTTTVIALLVASTQSGVVDLKDALQTLQQSSTGNTLISVDGKTYTQVILDTFTPAGAMRPCTGGWGEAYQATFFHTH